VPVLGKLLYTAYMRSCRVSFYSALNYTIRSTLRVYLYIYMYQNNVSKLSEETVDDNTPWNIKRCIALKWLYVQYTFITDTRVWIKRAEMSRHNIQYIYITLVVPEMPQGWKSIHTLYEYIICVFVRESTLYFYIRPMCIVHWHSRIIVTDKLVWFPSCSP